MRDLDGVVRAAALALTPEELCRPVLIGVSGGADSQALLHLLIRWARDLDAQLHAVHVDHGLRQESGADAKQVRALCERWGVRVTVERVSIDRMAAGRAGGLEAAARRARFRAFADVSSALGARVLALGHQRDDQAETLLLHLLRGSGLAGLRGMTVVARQGTALDRFPPGAGRPSALWRPLLDVSRVEIEAYCRQNGLRPLSDPTNEDQSLRRNAVRHAILPAIERHFPHARATLARTAQLVGDDAAMLEALAVERWGECAHERDGVVTFARPLFRAQPAAIQRRLVRRAWEAAVEGSGELAADATESVCRLIARGRTGSRLMLPGGVRCLVEREWAHVGGGANLGPRLLEDLGLPLLEEGQVLRLREGGVCGGAAGSESPPDLAMAGGWTLRVACEGAQRGRGDLVEAGAEEPTPRRAAPRLHIPGELLREAGSDLVLRTWQPGDWVLLPRGRGRQKLQDWFVNRGVPRYARQRLALVAVGKRVLWVVGLATFVPEADEVGTARESGAAACGPTEALVFTLGGAGRGRHIPEAQRGRTSGRTGGRSKGIAPPG